LVVRRWFLVEHEAVLVEWNEIGVNEELCLWAGLDYVVTVIQGVNFRNHVRRLIV
jgi:hypothetical protein